MSIIAQEPFTGTGALSASWTIVFNSGATAPTRTSDQLGMPSAVSGLVNWNANTPANDHYAKLTISTRTAAADAGFGPAVRLAAAALTGYFAQAGASDTRLYLLNGGGFTQLGSSGSAVTAGHVLELRAQGTTITLLDNGTPICGTPLTNAVVASGRGGFWFAGESTDRGDDWELGDFAAGAATIIDENEWNALEPQTNPLLISRW